MPTHDPLPPGVQVFERGWLSSNNLLLTDTDCTVLIDSGYATHAAQTVALVQQALGQRPLDVLANTHLHSDHCGGNAALQAAYPGLHTLIPPGLSAPVRAWDEDGLSYRPTGQTCPPFRFQGLLESGQTRHWAGLTWEVHAAPGHDPHSVVLFAPGPRLLVSADALWENGFGVVFPELEGLHAFDEVAASLDLIERLDPACVVPGHGPVFEDVAGALARARRKLEAFAQAPDKHARYGAKVLLKFKLLEWGRIGRAELLQWSRGVQYLQNLHQRYGAGSAWSEWIEQLLADLARSGALHDGGEVIEDRSV